MRRLALLPLAAIAFVIVAATPVAAATAKPVHAYSPGVRNSAPVSPSGCYQHVDDPHKSLHLGVISGELRTKCRNPIPEIWQSAQLWEQRWWGWDRVGSRGVKQVYWVSQITSWADVSCRKSYLKVTGTGYVIDVDEDKYTASTSSPAIYNPCKL